MYDMVSNRDSVRNVYSSPVSSDSRSCLLLACVFRFKKLSTPRLCLQIQEVGYSSPVSSDSRSWLSPPLRSRKKMTARFHSLTWS